VALRRAMAKKAATDASDTRYLFAGLVACDVAGVPRAGVTSPVGTNLVTASATMNVSVARFQAVAVRDSGALLLANDGPANVLIGNAPGPNSRLYLITAKQNDSSSTVLTPDGDDLPVFGVLVGTPSATPVRNPAGLPAGAIELATIQVPAGATATNSGGVVITQTAQFTAAAGAPIPVRVASDLTSMTTFPTGQLARCFGDGITYRFNGTAWKPWESDAVTYSPTIGGISGGTRAFKWWWSAGEVVVSGQVSGIVFSSITGVVTISIPAGTIDSTLGTSLGSGILVDASLGEVYDVAVRSSGTSAALAERRSVVGGNVKLASLNGTGAAGTNGAVLTLNFRFRSV
jgi:hypothetical protein